MLKIFFKKKFLLGFNISLILMIISIYILEYNINFINIKKYILIFLINIIRILIHINYFLNLNLKSKKKWNLLSLIFTIIIIIIIFVGSIWVMKNLNNHN